ncbi:Abi family protein [Rathayibacter festucae]|jgi:abortive infection bacteriophage resistance protein|uniref:CAAX protease n=1 Tax=Rathayibacter festucae DSM 15932 TaxID=1328866 RepID=A0A3T0T5D4_9MICO|nr:Abi family protein [Rathayibacter festucae]AZZ53770.1 hypothetical protein C1I64_18150 [Rathayibacter festucae DSM 15932]
MSKPSLSIAQQIELLRERGFDGAVSDSVLARFLYDHSYYRASGYWRYFQVAPHDGDNRFEPGVTLDRIRDLYRFDAVVRSIVMDGLSDLEIAVRARLGHHLSEGEDGAGRYLRPHTYATPRSRNGAAMRVDLLRTIGAEVARTKEHCVAKYRDTGDVVPVWVAMEVLSFGTVSKMYRLLDDEPVRETIAKGFGLNESRRLDSTLHSLSVLRNVCAHHGRIWNRVVAVKPFVLNRLRTEADPSIYLGTPWGWFVVLADLVDGVRGGSGFSTKLFDFIAGHPEWEDGLKHPHRR